jgi:hypothetical protein
MFIYIHIISLVLDIFPFRFKKSFWYNFFVLVFVEGCFQQSVVSFMVWSQNQNIEYTLILFSLIDTSTDMFITGSIFFSSIVHFLMAKKYKLLWKCLYQTTKNVNGHYLTYLYDLSIEFWNCSDSVVFLGFSYITFSESAVKL